MRLTTGRLAAATIGGPLLVAAVGVSALNMVGTFANASARRLPRRDPASGRAALHRRGGRVVAHGRHGNVNATALGATSVQVSSGNGNVHLGWAPAPKAGTATSGNGSIHLTVPKGSGP